jgi:hypothetical protein
MLATKFLALGRRAVPRRPVRLGQCACTIARRQRGGKVAEAGKAPEGEDASDRRWRRARWAGSSVPLAPGPLQLHMYLNIDRTGVVIDPTKFVFGDAPAVSPGVGSDRPSEAERQNTRTAWCPRRELPPLGCSYPSASGYEPHDVATSVDASTQSGRARQLLARTHLAQYSISEPAIPGLRGGEGLHQARSPLDTTYRVGDTTALLRARQHRAREHRAGVRVADELDGAGRARALAPLGWIRARCYGRAVRVRLDPERGTS